jgi:hypothetical protein
MIGASSTACSMINRQRIAVSNSEIVSKNEIPGATARPWDRSVT